MNPFNYRNHPHYRRMVNAYLRQGHHSYLITKQQHSTTHYIWRTQGDSNVRESHAKNNGKIFAWDDRPETGHPGEDYGCRCTAEPYNPDVKEFMNITLHDVNDTGPEWDDCFKLDYEGAKPLGYQPLDYNPPKDILNGEWYGYIQGRTHMIPSFVSHYLEGNGQPVRLRDTGLLKKVVKKYIHLGAIKRLKKQIASEARLNIGKAFYDDFTRPYDMGSVKFSLGHSTIKGNYNGNSKLTKDGLFIEGNINFKFYDEFADPLDIGIEITGIPYRITDKWRGRFKGIIHPEAKNTSYHWVGEL